jgi:hypothetical protein
MSDIVSTSTVEPSRGGGIPRVLFGSCALAWLSRRAIVPRLATLNILRGRRFPPATAYVQFSRIDNWDDCTGSEQVFARSPGSALRLRHSQHPSSLRADHLSLPMAEARGISAGDR